MVTTCMFAVAGTIVFPMNCVNTNDFVTKGDCFHRWEVGLLKEVRVVRSVPTR